MENYKDYYSWQEAIEDLHASISLTLDIIEHKESIGEDVHDLYEDIAQYYQEITELEERNKPVF